MEQKSQALFCIDAGESITKITNDLGIEKQNCFQLEKGTVRFLCQLLSNDCLGNRIF